MKCPACGHPESKVLDSRPANEGNSIRRRRECLKCQKRFTTFETIESVSFVVVKKDKTRESFDRMKLLNGLVLCLHRDARFVKKLIGTRGRKILDAALIGFAILLAANHVFRMTLGKELGLFQLFWQ